jgi:hypothetical protein
VEKRRFTRFKIVEKCFVDYQDGSTEVDLRDISLNGAMVESRKTIPFKKGDGICLSFPLGHSDKYLQFNAEVVHAQDRIAGVQFIETDLGTLVDLHALLKANTDDIEQINREFNFLSGA